ncbi:hypothetical protein R84B8_02541 [Treponema sp. R8-4-B8]
MANKCGDCQFFTGSGRCDQGNKSVTSSSGVADSCMSFKAPASLFSGKNCGGCRHFEGSGRCDKGNRTTLSSSNAANSCSSYASIPG